MTKISGTVTTAIFGTKCARHIIIPDCKFLLHEQNLLTLKIDNKLFQPINCTRCGSKSQIKRSIQSKINIHVSIPDITFSIDIQLVSKSLYLVSDIENISSCT